MSFWQEATDQLVHFYVFGKKFLYRAGAAETFGIFYETQASKPSGFYLKYFKKKTYQRKLNSPKNN